MLPFDLHVLGMPPAFNLSQDQTLQFNPSHQISSDSTSISFSKHFKVPTQFVFLILNEPRSFGVMRILLVLILLSNSFLFEQ